MTPVEIKQKYHEFVARIEEKWRSIHDRHPSSFACQKGCFGCCQKDLTVNQLERDIIRDHLQRSVTLASFEANGKPGYCEFLDGTGACTIFAARPIICRTHGAPVRFKSDQDQIEVDVCPLNFTGEDLHEVPAEDFFNIDTVNTVLATLNLAYGGAEGATNRYPLKLASFEIPNQ